MLVLGLNSAHDAGVALVDDGRIVGMIQRERLTRIKRNALLTADFIEECLVSFGVAWKDIDLVALSTSQSWPLMFVDRDAFSVSLTDAPAIQGAPAAHTAESLEHAFNWIRRRNREHADAVSLARARSYFARGGSNAEYFLESPEDFLKSDADFLALLEWPTMPADWWEPDFDKRAAKGFQNAEGIRLRNYLPARFTLRGESRPGLLVPHHLAHAAGAYFQSDFETAVVHTVDNGDVFVPFRGYVGGMLMVGVGNRLLPVSPSYAYHGHFYQRVSEKLGLGFGGGAGKLMGLAPYGEPRYFANSMVGDAFETFGERYAKGDKGGRDGVLKQLYQRLADAKSLDLPGFGGHSAHFDPELFGAADLARPGIDLAATAQTLFEQCTLSILSRFLRVAYASTGWRGVALCLGGGGALNCPVNSAAWRTLPVRDVFVPPACDDSGLPIGAAMAACHDYMDRPRVPQDSRSAASAYLGRQFDDHRLTRAVSDAAEGLVVDEIADPAADAAAAVAGNAVVAWFEGRSEIGPRALGHRSILADARNPGTWRRVNAIKKREYWRPFAPAVLSEDHDDWFRGSPSVSPHMLFTATVKGDALPGITHVDGSARVQTVDPSAGQFRAVLEHFKRLTGVPVVLNTSLNGPGEPIVDTPEEAVAFLKNSEVDALYLGPYRVKRRGA